MLNASVLLFLRIFFRSKAFPLYTVFLGYLGDLFIISVIFFVFPLKIAALLGLFLQLLTVLDRFLYQKLQLRFKFSYLSHLFHPRALFHSVKEMGLSQFIGLSVGVIGLNIVFFQQSSLSFSGLVPLILGGLTIVGRLYLTNLQSYAVTNFLFLIRTQKIELFTSIPDSSEDLKQRHVKINSEDKPHLLLVYLESFGTKYLDKLPRFQELIKEGIYFSNFYANGTVTYRALLSGLFGVMPGMTSGGLGPYVDLPLTGLPELLKQNGYKTAFLHSGSLKFDRQADFLTPHFDELIDQNQLPKDPQTPNSWGVPDEYLMEYTVEWLLKQKQPAFGTLFTITNHHPWILPSTYQAPDFGFPSNGYLERYLRTLHYTDHVLGRLIDRLREVNLSTKTVIVIVGDHGQPMEEHHGNHLSSRLLYEENVHVPLLILADKKIDQPCILDDLGSHIDLLATIADLLNLPQERGSSLLRHQPNRSVMLNNPYGIGCIGCREGKWKWIECRISGAGELYDLSTDPFETKNLVNQEKETAEKLRCNTQSYFKGNQIKHNTVSKAIDLSSQLITDQDLLKVLNPEIQELNLNHCVLLTGEGIHAIFSHCPHLTKLQLKGIRDLTSRAFQKAPHLQYLDLTDVDQMTDDDLLRIKECFPHLSTLFLNCSSLSESSLQTLGPPLTTLHLYAVHHNLNGLLNNNRQLIRLEINGCEQLTDETLKLMKHHPIEYLVLRDAPHLTDASLSHLLHLPLKTLSLTNCTRITPDGLLSLLQLKLKCLRLENCSPIPPEYIQKFEKAGVVLIFGFS
jgi:arylsulfatase A-like enzyme